MKSFKMHIHEEKSLVRAQTLARITSLSETDRRAESRSICKQILQKFPHPSSVCGYFPLTTEVDIRPVLLSYLERKIPVFLPVFTKNSFEFKQIFDFTQLPVGELNIPEPTTSAANYIPDATGIVLVPGRAFTSSGYRIGRGNGGYDQWIASITTKQPITIGVSFEVQLLNTLPLEPHDQKLDHVITARKLY